MSDSGSRPGKRPAHPTRPAGDPRLAALGRRLDEARGTEVQESSGRDAASKPRNEMLGMAFSLAGQLAAGVGVGVLLGWQLDRLFATRPLLLIVLTMVGAAAGLWSVIRTANRMHRLQQVEDETAKRKEQASGG